MQETNILLVEDDRMIIENLTEFFKDRRISGLERRRTGEGNEDFKKSAF